MMAEENKELNTNVMVVEEMADKLESASGGEEADIDIDVLKEMAEKGLMYGHKKTRTNPKFRTYIFTTRNGIEIIDLTKTFKAIDSAADFLNKQLKEKKMVLLVGIQPASWEALENFSKKFSFPLITNKWIGGLITNYKNLSQRIEYFKKIQSGMEKGEFDKYTKKERVMINKNLSKMKEKFEGVKNLTKIPDVLFVVDASLKNHVTAIKEARNMKIPVVAIIDSDDNPEIIAYPIPANDHSKMSIDWIINRIDQQLITNDQQQN